MEVTIALSVAFFLAGYLCGRTARRREVTASWARREGDQEYLVTPFKHGQAAFIEPVTPQERFDRAETVDDLVETK